MNRAIVAVRAGSTGGDRVFLIGVKRWRFLKLLVDADDGVRFLVSINPGDCLTRLDSYGLRIEGEIFDLDLVFHVPGGGTVFHLVSPCGKAEIEEDQNEQQDCFFVSSNERNHVLNELTKV